MNTITMQSGRRFDLLNPQPGDVDIRDIAFHLARIFRFGGGTDYTVAQHCVVVSMHCPSPYRLQGLLHDAAEAYYGDLTRPLKYMPGMEAYRNAEKRGNEAVFARFGIAPEIPSVVKDIDEALLMTERNTFLKNDPGPWDREVPPLPVPGLRAWSIQRSEKEFLRRFRALTARSWSNVAPRELAHLNAATQAAA